MPGPEITPQQIGHQPFKPTKENKNISSEKQKEYIELGKSIAELDGISEEDIGHMPDIMMDSFLEARKKKK